MSTESPAGPVRPGLSPRLELDADRQRRESRFREALEAYAEGRITLTRARIQAGIASRRERLAYRFPRLFGSLCRLSSTDRLRPVYYADAEPDRPVPPPVDIDDATAGRLRLLPRGTEGRLTSGNRTRA